MMSEEARVYERKSQLLFVLPGLSILVLIIAMMVFGIFFLPDILLKIASLAFLVFIVPFTWKTLKKSFAFRYHAIEITGDRISLHTEHGPQTFSLPGQATKLTLEHDGHLRFFLLKGAAEIMVTTWEFKNNRELRERLYDIFNLHSYGPGEELKKATPGDVIEEMNRPQVVSKKSAIIAICLFAAGFILLPLLAYFLDLDSRITGLAMIISLVGLFWGIFTARQKPSRSFISPTEEISRRSSQR